MAYRPQTVRSRRELLVDAQRLVGQCFGDPGFNLQAVARDLATSDRQVQRAFEDHGLAFRAYLLEVRMTRALQLVRDTDDSIASIAARVGYSQAPHFAKVFQRVHGASPSAYRIAGRAAAA